MGEHTQVGAPRCFPAKLNPKLKATRSEDAHWGSPQPGSSECAGKEEGAWEGLGGRVTWSGGKVSWTGPPL